MRGLATALAVMLRRSRCATDDNLGMLDRSGPSGVYDAKLRMTFIDLTFSQMGRTLYDKIWDDHLVANNPRTARRSFISTGTSSTR